MAELFKFRCYQCQKLIGAPASRFGQVVKCPQCRVELIVPSPEDKPAPDPDPDDPDAFRPEDLGLSLDPGPLLNPKPTPAPSRPEVGPDPIAFLTRVAESGDEPEPRENTDADPDPDAEATPPLIEPADEPLVPRVRGRAASRGEGASPRSRDVLLPRTAVVAWALVALLGLAFAFVSGLLVGQRMGR